MEAAVGIIRPQLGLLTRPGRFRRAITAMFSSGSTRGGDQVFCLKSTVAASARSLERLEPQLPDNPHE
jgi:hypothetical protein